MLQTPEPITWALEGKYDVTLTVTNDYGSDTETKEEYIDVQPIGITEIDLDGLIKVYPNPAYGMLNIENATGEDINLSIYTLTGQQIIESRVHEGTSQLNLESLEAGIYFVRYITESQQVKTGKLIIK
jgi:PKD repeat protein